MDQSDSETCLYFAIGSMMNPVSLQNRELFPIESKPGEILDYKIVFFGQLGMAEAFPEEGQSFHGVVHKLNIDQMQILDKIESLYTRVPAKVKLYDGQIVEASVYTRPNAKARNPDVDKPPTERYIDIMVRGAIHFGVQQSYIDWLKSLEVQPRIKPQDFMKFEIPEGLPLMTIEELRAGNGRDGNPLYFAINGKVRQYCEGYTMGEMMRKQAGGHLELWLSKVLYEPLYGTPERIEDFTREHCAMIEDFNYRMNLKSEEFQKYCKFVGLIEQKYRD